MPRSPRVPVAGGQVVQHQLQAVGVAARRLDLGCREGIGEQELDRLEAGLRGALEAVEERHLGEEHRQVGGEAWAWLCLRGVRAISRAGAIAVGASSGVGASSSNSLIVSISVPIAMLVTRSRITSITTGT